MAGETAWKVIAAVEAWKDDAPSRVWQERTHRLSTTRAEAADAVGSSTEKSVIHNQLFN
jgi:hypothetical protein